MGLRAYVQTERVIKHGDQVPNTNYQSDELMGVLLNYGVTVYEMSSDGCGYFEWEIERQTLQEMYEQMKFNRRFIDDVEETKLTFSEVFEIVEILLNTPTSTDETIFVSWM